MNEHKDIVVVVGLADNQSEFLGLFDKVFLFHCDEEVFLERIKNRINNDFGKHDSEKEMILSWYKDYQKEMLGRGAVPINTTEPLDMVVEKVLKQITV